MAWHKKSGASITVKTPSVAVPHPSMKPAAAPKSHNAGKHHAAQHKALHKKQQKYPALNEQETFLKRP